jgi:REP-associated tyrosine transposase
MPRQSRIDAPGALHHVMIRGIEKRVIFRDDRDREAFLDRMGGILVESSTPCYAWSLLDNHAHFLLRTGKMPISRVMRKLLTGYAVTFNKRHRRHGHLFQNRYKSILCEEGTYLQELVRYIHLNPFRAGLVKGLRELGSYPYSGHSVLMGKNKRAWQDRDYVLRYFGQTEREAKKRYVSFVSKGIEEGSRPDLAGGGLLRTVGGWKGLKDLRDSGERVRGDERILGGSEFVERVLRESDEEWEKKSLLRQRGVNLERLLEKVASQFGVDSEDLRSGSKVSTVAKARAVLCYLGVRKLGLTSATISKELGISPSAVSKAIVRAQKGLQPDDIELP